MEQSASDIVTLTQGLSDGREEAWQRFHLQYGPRIFRHLLAATRGNYDLSTEGLQQTYLRVARYARPCSSESEFLAWLRTVTQSALRDLWRRQGTIRRLLDRFLAQTDSPSVAPATEEVLFFALDQAMAELDESDRALLTAKYLRDESMADIARRLSLTTKAVESRLTRARLRVRARIDACLASHSHEKI